VGEGWDRLAARQKNKEREHVRVVAAAPRLGARAASWARRGESGRNRERRAWAFRCWATRSREKKKGRNERAFGPKDG